MKRKPAGSSGPKFFSLELFVQAARGATLAGILWASLGAILGGAFGAAFSALTPSFYVAAASVLLESNDAAWLAAGQSPRQIVAKPKILRETALAPEVRPILQRASRAPYLEQAAIFLGLSSNQDADSLSRAINMLAQRIEVDRSARSGVVEISTRMESAKDAAILANALAKAFIDDRNALTASIQKQRAQDRDATLAKATQTLDLAQSRLAALRAIDFTPTASVIPFADSLSDDNDAAKLASLRQSVVEARRLLNEAALVYGSRHPTLLERQANLNHAQAALAKAMRQPRKTKQAPPPANFGLDEQNLIENKIEIERAENDVVSARKQQEAALAMASRWDSASAKILEEATPPTAPTGLSTGMTTAAASLLGCLLFAIAPTRRKGAKDKDENNIIKTPQNNEIQNLRKKSYHYDEASQAHYREIIEALNLGVAADAETLLVATDPKCENVTHDPIVASLEAQIGFCLGYAALQEGWNVLLIAPRNFSDDAFDVTENELTNAIKRYTEKPRWTKMDNKLYSLTRLPTNCGALHVAAPIAEGDLAEDCGDGPVFDARRDFDLVLFLGARAGACDTIWPAQKRGFCLRLAASNDTAEEKLFIKAYTNKPEQFLGTLLCDA